MIDFSKNTYFVKRTEKDAIIKILKQHPEYRGFNGLSMLNNRGFNIDNHMLLWEQIEEQFKLFRSAAILYLDNEYIKKSTIQQHPWLVGLAEVYNGKGCVQYDPQPLLPELKKLYPALIKVE